METADFWLHEKALVHKLFKVFVPRYVDYSRAFTSIFYLAPKYDAAVNEKTSWQERVANRSGAFPAYNSRWVQLERAVVEFKGKGNHLLLFPAADFSFVLKRAIDDLSVTWQPSISAAINYEFHYLFFRRKSAASAASASTQKCQHPDKRADVCGAGGRLPAHEPHETRFRGKQ